ncbi:AcrR family transcriptional regulator [Weissella uvarum]|uniref:TetR/AcrR family transcriptional regulator n=1 Tax=Weissella uvarum TaxID=1479233 RepID=UPI00195FF006|nr:TetR/AcrR family transcriptional regulator [Weissella uvarum]MBM7617012.1 AcrR family transcriptional regulator [Weissella uvarum]MCM0595310.1 TetR/AcrR family transcriptional regulator [Weissella uvarum]
MVSSTFEKLNPDKKRKLKQVLIDEFSNYTLDQAQVARIVKTAGISRGSFYTYFDDLYDAYMWVLREILMTVHQHHSADPFQGTIAFIKALPKNPYYDFLDKYFQVNESLIKSNDPKAASRYAQMLPDLDEDASNQDVTAWLALVSTHQLIQDRFAYPDHADDILKTLSQLSVWLKDRQD